MKAITVIEATASLPLPPDLSCADWLDVGRDLMRKDRETKWQTADWMAYGRARARTDSTFSEQMDLHLPDTAEDRRHLDALARIAEVFPADERSLELSFDHYAALSRLPHGEARKLLEKAAKDRATPRDVKYMAMQAQLSITPRSAPDADSMLEAFVAHWNRLPRSVREEAAELIGEAGGQEIDV